MTKSYGERYEALRKCCNPQTAPSEYADGLLELISDAQGDGDGAWRLFFEGRLAIHQDRHEESLELLGEALEVADESTADRKTLLASAMGCKGFALATLDRPEDAVAACDEVVARFGNAEEASLRVEVARALGNKGVALGKLDRPEESISVYDQVVSRFGDAEEASLREVVARALVNTGVTLGKLYRPEEEMSVYDQVVARFGDAEEASLREEVASALVNKGIVLGDLDRPEDAVAACDEVVARFGNAEEASLQEQVAMALFNKGVVLGELDRPEEAISVYDEVDSRFGNAEEASLREQVAKALVNKGGTLGELDRPEEEISVYDEVVSRFGDAEEPTLCESVARALVNKGLTLKEQGRAEEEISVYDEVVSRFGDAEEASLRERVAHAQAFKARALTALGREPEAREAQEAAEDISPKATRVRENRAFSDHELLISKINNLLSGLMQDTNKVKKFRERIDNGVRRTNEFLTAESKFSNDRSILLILREWNSYTPIVPDLHELNRGGGYFLRHPNNREERYKGIVIDPGYNFIENFYKAGGRIHDIDAIAVTHAHDDHTADFEPLLSLLHQYNSRCGKGDGAPKQVDLYMSLGAYQKLSVFLDGRNDPRIGQVVLLNRVSIDQPPQTHKVFPGLKLTVLPAYHDDLKTADGSVGFCFDLTFNEDGKEQRRIVFTGDTGLYPKELDEDGKPKLSEADEGGKKHKLLATKEGERALHKRYGALMRCMDGGNERIDCFIPHLGSIKKYELKHPKLEMGQPLLYPDHLGLRGMAILLDGVPFRTGIISEFGEELSEIRCDIARILGEALQKNEQDESESKVVFPGDVTLVYDIEQRKFLCHQTHDFVSPDELLARQEKVPNEDVSHVYLEKKDKQQLDDTNKPLTEYHEKLKERDLPHFR